MAINLKDRLARQASGNSLLTFDPTGRDEPQLATLPISAIDPDPNQPRRALGDLSDLALSIQEHGLLNPIIVEAATAGRYRILAGERRFSACRSLGRETVICIVRTVEEQNRLALQLIENMHRKDLSPVEEAQGLRRLMEEFNLTQRELAQRVGKSVGAVNQMLRILDLEPTLLADLQTSEHASKSVLLEIAKESDPQKQRDLAAQAQAGELTVREARARKPKTSSPSTPPVTIRLADATVVVRFVTGESTPERMLVALRAALTEVSKDTAGAPASMEAADSKISSGCSDV